MYSAIHGVRCLKMSKHIVEILLWHYHVENFTNDSRTCKPLLLYVAESFSMIRSEIWISQLCRAWRCVNWKVFKVSTDVLSYWAYSSCYWFVCVGHWLLKYTVSHRKSSFAHCHVQLVQLFVDYLCWSCELHWVVFIFPRFCFVILLPCVSVSVCLSVCPFAATVPNKDLYKCDLLQR